MPAVSKKEMKWQLTERTKGGLGGNWIHISYYRTRSEAEKQATKVRKEYKGIARRLNKRNIKFTSMVNVSKRGKK